MAGSDAAITVAGLTVIDISVFVIDFRYKRDRNFPANRAFLDRVAEEGGDVTSIFNLLEVCGILSFNLNEKQLRELFFYFSDHYHIDVLPHTSREGFLPAFELGDLFDIVLRRAGFGDALIIAAVEKYIAGAARFVSWNAEHFKGRLTFPSLAPREYLKKAE